MPSLTVEPGRAIVGRAGVALYRIGGIKNIPGVRTYISVDGGMGDNIRPALYDAAYTVTPVMRPASACTQTATIAGKFCESGDLLAKDVPLPDLAPGDLIALPASGAYCVPMASNYNMAPRPAIVMVVDGGRPADAPKRVLRGPVGDIRCLINLYGDGTPSAIRARCVCSVARSVWDASVMPTSSPGRRRLASGRSLSTLRGP